MEYLSSVDYLRMAKEIMEQHKLIVPELDELIEKLENKRKESNICSFCNGTGRLEKWDYTGTRMTGHYTCYKCKGTGKKIIVGEEQ